MPGLSPGEHSPGACKRRSAKQANVYLTAGKDRHFQEDYVNIKPLADEVEGNLRHLIAQLKQCLRNINHQIQELPDTPMLRALSACFAPVAQNVEALDKRMNGLCKVLRESENENESA